MDAESDDNINARAARARKGTPFLCSAQAAFYLGIAEITLKRHRYNGTGPIFRRHTRNVLYHIDDLDAWSRQTSETGT